MTTIILDNGHGDNTPGKRSPWSACKVKPELDFYEWKYNRELIPLLINALCPEGFEVLQLVSEDTDITLAERVRRINNKVKDNAARGNRTLLISLHNNAAGKGDKWTTARGWSAWTTRGQNNSDKLADCLYEAADKILPPLGQKVRKDKSDGDADYEADFYILKGANCPAVLIEQMFQDNIEDVKWLLTDEGREALVEIVKDGVKSFVEKMKW